MEIPSNCRMFANMLSARLRVSSRYRSWRSTAASWHLSRRIVRKKESHSSYDTIKRSTILKLYCNILSALVSRCHWSLQSWSFRCSRWSEIQHAIEDQDGREEARARAKSQERPRARGTQNAPEINRNLVSRWMTRQRVPSGRRILHVPAEGSHVDFCRKMQARAVSFSCSV